MVAQNKSVYETQQSESIFGKKADIAINLKKVEENKIEENGVENQADGSEDEKKKIMLNQIIEYESTNFQWQKVFLNWGLIAMLILVSLMKGGSTEADSLLGIVKCHHVDWILFILL